MTPPISVEEQLIKVQRVIFNFEPRLADAYIAPPEIALEFINKQSRITEGLITCTLPPLCAELLMKVQFLIILEGYAIPS